VSSLLDSARLAGVSFICLVATRELSDTIDMHQLFCRSVLYILTFDRVGSCRSTILLEDDDRWVAFQAFSSKKIGVNF
jgi:hypothetical protein